MSFFYRWWENLATRFAKRTTEERAATGLRLSGYVALLRRFGASDPRTMAYVADCSAADPKFEKLWRTAGRLYDALAPKTTEERLSVLGEMIEKWGVSSPEVARFCELHHGDEGFRLKAFIMRCGAKPWADEGEEWKQGRGEYADE